MFPDCEASISGQSLLNCFQASLSALICCLKFSSETCLHLLCYKERNSESKTAPCRSENVPMASCQGDKLNLYMLLLTATCISMLSKAHASQALE